jgi:predicted metalloprotease with PDZ domain
MEVQRMTSIPLKKFFPFSQAISLIALLVVGAVASAVALAAEDTSPDLAYKLHYKVTFEPEREGAAVLISVEKGELLTQLQFSNKENIYSDIRATGRLTVKDKRVTWELPQGQARLSYFVKLTKERSPGKYDARVTKDWAIFRGDNLIPPVQTAEKPGAYAIATLEFVLPESWGGVETGWPRKEGNTFTIDNPERLFDRPIGWMIAGDIGSRNARIAKTSIVVSGPKGENFRRMDALVFFNFVWPEVAKAFKHAPEKLLVVGADDPMWRGGLSASNSLFLHADRPLVSENGTSPLLHELTHMVTRISGLETKTTNDDWIAEGLAEFYSFELLYRANGMTKARRTRIINGLAKWGKDVTHLRKSKSTGPITARAVVLLDELNSELKARSNKKYDLDDVTRELMKKRKVSLDDLRQATESLIGPDIETLKSSLLK